MKALIKSVREFVGGYLDKRKNCFGLDRVVEREAMLRARLRVIPYYANRASMAYKAGGYEAERKYWDDIYHIYLASSQGFSGGDVLAKVRQWTGARNAR